MKPPAAVGLAGVFALAALTACSNVRWSGYAKGKPDDAARTPKVYEIEPSTAPAHPMTPEPWASGLAEAPSKALYYSDLGPDTIDVSRYPTQQKYNYALYAQACSRCHTLARSINAPAVSRSYWNFYMLGLRFTSVLEKKDQLTKAERKAILDFLEYDSKVRKVDHEREFNALTEELKGRFAPIFEERLRRLNESGQPRILR